MSVILAIVNRLDRGDCGHCGAPAEDRHTCWRVIFDRLREWAERQEEVRRG